MDRLIRLVLIGISLLLAVPLIQGAFVGCLAERKSDSDDGLVRYRVATLGWHDNEYSIAFIESELVTEINHLKAMSEEIKGYGYAAVIRDEVLYVDDEIGNEADMMFNLRTKAGW
ncbi:MAG: hypothetical protein ACKVJU_01300 [Verrucomicrobiales bacterium]